VHGCNGGHGGVCLRRGGVVRLRSMEEAPRGATVSLIVEHPADGDPPATATIKAGLGEAGRRLSGAEAVIGLGVIPPLSSSARFEPMMTR
jgi:hypothetical protein